MITKHIIRIRNDAVRIPLWCLWAPFTLIGTLLDHAMPARLGGHPNKWRFLEADYWWFNYGAIFLIGWDGSFVGLPIRGGGR